MPIKKNTILTTDEAVRRLDDKSQFLSPRGWVLLREYAECLGRLSWQQEQQIMNLLLRRGVESEEWLQVHQLVEDLSYNKVDERLRSKLKELEQQLQSEGVL